MAVISENISQWPCLSDGLHYKWLVDYAAFSAFGTFELSPEEWEKRELIVNFKGNSELTTEIDHQQALKKAIDMAVADAGLTMADIESVGVGTPGSVNQDTGMIEFSNNLAFISHIHPKSHLLEICLGNLNQNISNSR